MNLGPPDRNGQGQRATQHRDAGEDQILYCPDCDYCVNLEISTVKVGDKCHRCGGTLKQATASEVGNVFDLGQKYGQDFKLSFTAQDGSKKYPYMGCYGIGISRVMGVIAEKCNDEKGLIWPGSVAPFQVHLIGLDLDEKEVLTQVDKVYKLLQVEGIEVLFDDRVDISAGAKFADADLIGIPLRVVISKRSAGQLELKRRGEKNTEFVSFAQLLEVVR